MSTAAQRFRRATTATARAAKRLKDGRCGRCGRRPRVVVLTQGHRRRLKICGDCRARSLARIALARPRQQATYRTWVADKRRRGLCRATQACLEPARRFKCCQRHRQEHAAACRAWYGRQPGRRRQTMVTQRTARAKTQKIREKSLALSVSAQ